MEADLRPGGKWEFHRHSRWRYPHRFWRVSPDRAVYTWAREQEDAAETVVRRELEEKSGITQVRVTQSGLTSESLRARNSGWPLIVGLLQAYVEGRPARAWPDRHTGHGSRRRVCWSKRRRLRQCGALGARPRLAGRLSESQCAG